MNTYRITVREIIRVEYSVEAETEEEARELVSSGNQQVVNEYTIDWDIIRVQEKK